jgi:hypothetical protein
VLPAPVRLCVQAYRGPHFVRLTRYGPGMCARDPKWPSLCVMSDHWLHLGTVDDRQNFKQTELGCKQRSRRLVDSGVNPEASREPCCRG